MKSSKDDESSRDPKSKESKLTISSKGTSRSYHKSYGKSAHAEEPSHTVDDSRVQQNQEFDTGNNDEQPDNEAASKNDWFKKPERPPTPDPDWNKRQHVDFRPHQTWISVTARVEKPPTSFDELIDTPIDFSSFWYDYDHLDEIEVRREDQQLYTFKDGDFPRLRLQDIEDIHIVIQKRVEDLQLGVESYQKKLNLTKSDTFRLMRTDELYKFSDGALNDVWTTLYDIASRIRMEYLPKRKWSRLDKQRARVMIQDIDKQLFQRSLM
ncbi:hypothetical protein Tco_0490584 [Tanacetum coccineum]